MKPSSIASKINPLQPEIEFALILVWALLYPRKETLLYITVQALLLSLFSLVRLMRSRVMAVTAFGRGLAVANLLFLASAAFSASPGRSLLAAADLLLVSLYMALWTPERQRLPRFLDILAAVASVASLVNVIGFALHPLRKQTAVLFANPILQGIVAGLAVILLLDRLLSSRRLVAAAGLLVNLLSLLVSASKAAWLGTALLAAFWLLRKRPRALPWLAGLMALALLVPNPTQRKLRNWIAHDPYALNRIDIWGMSLRILRAHPWTGIGPEMFFEHARIHNFPQTRGPSRFGKIPESPHSDYLKVACETGVAGVLLTILFLVALARRLWRPPGLTPHKLALLFLLLEAALFNFLFSPFFSFLILFLCQPLFSEKADLSPWRRSTKAGMGFFLVFVFSGLYVLPYIADRLVARSERSDGIMERFDLLNQAGQLDFLVERIPLAKARLLTDFFRRRRDLGAWTAAMDQTQLALRRNRLSVNALLAEADLYIAFLANGMSYPRLEEEILRPLRRAVAADPHNPFIRLKTAVVGLRFGRDQAARREARAAIQLEPDFVAARQFLHDRFHEPADEQTYRQQLEAIAVKRRALNPRPGTYLFELLAEAPSLSR